MDLKEFTSEFMKFYKDDFIYIDTDSLEYEVMGNCLTGNILPRIPAYRREQVKDLIITNTESMFCANQILYASYFYLYNSNGSERDIHLYAKKLIDSFLMVEMKFKYNAHITTESPIPFTSVSNIKERNRESPDRYNTTITIGEDKNFVIETKGYLVKQKMHDT